MNSMYLKICVLLSLLLVCGCIQTNSEPIVISLNNKNSNVSNVQYKDYIHLPVTVQYKGQLLTGKFMIDTGSPYTILSKNFSQRLGLTLEGKSYFIGEFPISKKSYKMTAVFINKIDVANHTVSHVIVEYGDYLMTDIENVDGILGNDVLNQIGKFSMDYKNKTITWGI